MQGTELVVTATLRLASVEFSYFNGKFKSHLRANACFGVWPRYKSYLFLPFLKED